VWILFLEVIISLLADMIFLTKSSGFYHDLDIFNDQGKHLETVKKGHFL